MPRQVSDAIGGKKDTSDQALPKEEGKEKLLKGAVLVFTESVHLCALIFIT